MLRAKVAPDAKMTVVVLSDHDTRKTAQFFKLKALDASTHELVIVPLNNPDADEARLPIYAQLSDITGVPGHMICETPQGAWQYAAMHGYKVKPIMSEPTLVSATSVH